jgi:hypothetical protein
MREISPMLFKYFAFAKITALIVVISLAPTFVYAGLGTLPPDSRVSAPQPAPRNAGQVVSGRLIVRRRTGVSVNGNPAPSGTTVFPGSEIATADSASATLDLAPVGRLDLDSSSKVIVTFTDNGIDVTLLFGCVVLRMQKPGAVGVVHAPQGAPAQTSADNRQLDLCYKQGDAGPTPGQHTSAGAGVRAKGGLFGLGTAATIAIISGGIATTAILINTFSGRGDNPSSIAAG